MADVVDGGNVFLDPFIRNLGRFGAFSRTEMELLRAVPGPPRSHQAGRQILGEGYVGPPLALLSGWAYDFKLLNDGRRQIYSIFLPGDLVGVLPRDCARHRPALQALTSCTTVDLKLLAGALVTQPEQYAGLLHATRCLQAERDHFLHCQVIRLGRQTAVERMAHFLLELCSRLEALRAAAGPRYPMPLTQEQIADLLGLSDVHVNRTLQHMRHDGLIVSDSGHVTLIQRDVLESVGDWTAFKSSPFGDGG